MQTRTQPRTRRCSLSLVALILAAAPTLASAAQTTQTQTQTTPAVSDAAFARLDRNQDGYVDATEIGNDSTFREAYRSADLDHDGKLSSDEFAKAASIHERLRVMHFASDTLITARIKANLLRDPSVSVLAVSVETRNGEVILSGFVDNAAQSKRAREIAAGVDGVLRVHDELVIKG